MEETGGWVECENCKTDFAPGEQLERALKNTRVVTGAADLIMQAIRQKKERLS